jgi:hypothetical protein
VLIAKKKNELEGEGSDSTEMKSLDFEAEFTFPRLEEKPLDSL